MPLLDPDNFRHYVDGFNTMEAEEVVNLVPNRQAWDWMKENIPLFACPDSEMERMYYYRWWTFRKHIKQTPAGIIVTEFITPVRHAGMYNSISCALGHHLTEGRWLRNQEFLHEYVRFWFRADRGKPEPKFHNYSSWFAAALRDRSLVTGDDRLPRELLHELIADYARWEDEKRRPDRLFWQFDVRDGMEESISGSRTHKNARPTINSYMYANAMAIAEFAQVEGWSEVVQTYRAKANELKRLVQDILWDCQAGFFKAQTNENGLCDAREAIGFIPWCFRLPDQGYEQAWEQLIDPEGFWAPFGIATAERRHPRFRSHGVGKCEWDGAVWPFATSQTLGALANVLRHYRQPYVTSRHYFDAMRAYVKSQTRRGKPYIGEYLDESTGEWLKGDNPRSLYYNHSTFCDLIISGLVGLMPRPDETIELHPLLPPNEWEWFCLDNLSYHRYTLTIVWDRDGKRFGRKAGLTLFINDRPAAHTDELRPLATSLL